MQRPHALLVLALVASAGPITPAPAAEGKKYALLVGINEYAANNFENLKYAGNDAEELAKVLKAVGFSVRVLTSERGKKKAIDIPTRKNILKAFDQLRAKKTRDDTLLVGLAGHGVMLKVNGRDTSFFCPTDSDIEAPGTMIELTALVNDLNRCGARVKLLLVDACRNRVKVGRRNFNLDQKVLGNGVAVLFSCKGGECANETSLLGKGHGVFFHYVIEGLKGKARDRKGAISWLGLVDYVTEQVFDEAPKLLGKNAQQTPHYIANMEARPILVPAAPPRPFTPSRDQRLIKDGGKFFHPLTRNAADRKIKELTDKYKKEVVIETLAAVPADQSKKCAELGCERFFASYARQRCKGLKVAGVYIVICKDPGYVQVQTADTGHGAALTVGERDRVRDALLDEFREQEFNMGLLAGLAALEKVFKDRAAKKSDSKDEK